MITIIVLPLVWWFLPLLLPGIVGGLGATAIIAIAESLSRIAKRFTILGEKVSGKTTLHHFLTTGEVYVGEYKPGSSSKVTPKHILKMKDLELVIKESEDIAGGKQYRDQWDSLIKQADVICYLIRGDKVYAENREYISLIDEHISQIFEAKKEAQKLYLLITYLDTIPKYQEDAEIVKEQISEILETSAFKKNTKAIYGSLKTQESTELLVEQLISDILKDSKR